MKIFKLILILVVVQFIISCGKDKTTTTEIWEFTNLVNANLYNNGYLKSIDIYQKKGNEWRILQFEPDDYINFNLRDSIATTIYSLPVKDENAYMSSNLKFFVPSNNQIYYPDNIKRFPEDPILFDAFMAFRNEFPDMPTKYSSVDKFTAATYSYENAYDDNGKTKTYILYDFPNQKYVYYGFKDGTDLVQEKNLSELCPTCHTVDWKTMDAVTCTNSSDNSENYYFFDFDGKKMYVLSRYDKNTNNPKFELDANNIVSFDKAFFGRYSPTEDDKPFDFSK